MATKAKPAPAESGKKRNVDIAFTSAGTVLTWKFASGQVLTVDRTTLAAAVREQGEVWGLARKVMNAAAINRDSFTPPRSATAAEKFEACREVFDAMVAGNWNVGRTTAVEGAPLLLQALALAYPARPREVLAEFVGKQSAAAVAALLLTDKIAPHAATIRAAQTAGVDADAMLDEAFGE